MMDLLLLIAALAGTIAWIWTGYAEYSESAGAPAADDRRLGDPGGSLLDERAAEHWR